MSTIQDYPDWSENVIIEATEVTIPIEIEESLIVIDVYVTNAYLYIRTETGVSISVDIVAQSLGNILVDIAAQSVGNIAIDIASQTITVDINISAQSIDVKITNAVDATGAPVPLNIDIASQTVTLDVNIIASTVTLDVNIVGQVDTIDINVKAQEIYLNVYQEDEKGVFRGVSSEDIANVDTDLDLGLYAYGFWFPRGMYGVIDYISIYAKNTSGADQTITMEISLYHNSPSLIEKTVTISSTTTSYTWVRFYFGRPIWMYDPLFVKFKASASGVYVAGVSGNWGKGAFRDTKPIGIIPITKVIYIPKPYAISVFGTVNTIQIPNVTPEHIDESATVGAKSEVTLSVFKGTGKIKSVFFYTYYRFMGLRIYIDGKRAATTTPDKLNSKNVRKQKGGFRLLHYDAAANYYEVDYIKELPFKQKVEIKVYNPDTVSHGAFSELIVEALT